MDVTAARPLARTISPREQLVARTRNDSVFILEESQPEEEAGDQEAELREFVQEEEARLGAALGRSDLERRRSRRHLISNTDLEELVFLAHDPLQFTPEGSPTKGRSGSDAESSADSASAGRAHSEEARHASARRLAQLKRDAEEEVEDAQAELDAQEKRLERAQRDLDSRERQLESRERGEQYVERYEVIESVAGDLLMELERDPHDPDRIILKMIGSGSSSVGVKGIDDVRIGSALTHIADRPVPGYDQVADAIKRAQRPLRLLFEHVPYDLADEKVVVAKLTVTATENHGQQLVERQSLFAAAATYGAKVADSKDITSDDEGVPVVVADPPWGEEPFHNAGEMRGCAVVLARGRGVPLVTKCRMAQEAGAVMVVVVNIEDSPLMPEGSPEDDGGDITIPVVGVPSSAGQHFEAVDRARLGLDYTFDPDFDSMTMREYAVLTGDTEEWIDDSAAEKARQGAETVEVARFELQQARERLRTAQERKQAADRALRSAAGDEAPADSDLLMDTPAFSSGTDFQGLIQEEEQRLREAQHQLGLLETEAELRQRKFDEVMTQFDENTKQLQKEKTDDYHVDRKRLERRLVEDPSSLELQRELQAVEREHAVLQEEMRREKAALKQSYDQQLTAQQERHREEAEAWKNEEKEARAQLARLRNEREQLAIKMRHGTQAMLVDFESQIAKVKGQLDLNHEEGEDRDHRAITVAEIAPESVPTPYSIYVAYTCIFTLTFYIQILYIYYTEQADIKSADERLHEATERAKAAQKRAAEKRELMQREEEKIVQALAKPPRSREAPAERQRRIQGAVMIRRKIEGKNRIRLLTACFKSWADLSLGQQRRASRRAPSQEPGDAPVLAASPNRQQQQSSPYRPGNAVFYRERDGSVSPATVFHVSHNVPPGEEPEISVRMADGNVRETVPARLSLSPEPPPQQQRRRVDRERQRQPQLELEPEPELYLEAESEQAYQHSKRQPKPEPERPNSATKSARTKRQRASQSSAGAPTRTSHSTGMRQWKLTAKEGMYLTRDMVKQRRRHADDRIQKLERGTEIVELERQQIQAAEISTRRLETRLKCQVVFPPPATESERLTGWVDMDIRRSPAWKEVPRTLQTNTRSSRSPVADASRSPSGRAAGGGGGGGGGGKSPWYSDEEDEGGADVRSIATPIAEDADAVPKPPSVSRQGQSAAIEQWAQQGVLPRSSSSPEQRGPQAQSEGQWDQQAMRSEAAKALIAAQLAEARAQKLEAELAETRAALLSKSKTRKKKKKQSGGFQVPRVGKAEVIRGGGAAGQLDDEEARAIEAIALIKHQLEANESKAKPPGGKRSPSSAQRQSAQRRSPRQEQVFSSAAPSLEDIEAEAERLAAEDRALGGWADPTVPDDSAAWEAAAPGRRRRPSTAQESPLRGFRGSPTRSPPALESVRGGRRAVPSRSARASPPSLSGPRSPLSPPAESDWRESVDRVSGKRLWVNVRTRETTWLDPKSDRGGASPISPSAYSPGSPGSRPPMMRISARSVLSASD
eukprot:COSAG03_NODE_242_length_10073_cov_30.040405_7_plen_1514_part_00